MDLLNRVFAILAVLGEASESVTLGEISTQVALPRSTVHRLLNVLAGRDMVRQDPKSKRYRLGPGLLRFQGRYGSHVGLSDLVEPALRELSIRLGEAVFLTVLDGYEAVCARTIESPTPLSFFMRVGAAMPPHCAASARVIAAFQTPEIQFRLLGQAPYRRYSELTLTRRSEVMERLASIRDRGFDVCEEEMESGVTAIAVPVEADRKVVVASVTAIGPAERFSAPRHSKLVGELRRTAAQISTFTDRAGFRVAVGA